MKHTALAVALGLSFGFAPPVSAHHEGTCYISKNQSHICYVRTGPQSFAAAVTDGISPKPTVVAFDCVKGWSGKGELDRLHMNALAKVICDDHDLPKSKVLGA